MDIAAYAEMVRTPLEGSLEWKIAGALLWSDPGGVIDARTLRQVCEIAARVAEVHFNEPAPEIRFNKTAPDTDGTAPGASTQGH